MNDSHDIDMPYHPGCKHRYMEHLDHSALLKRLNEIADEIYRLTQLCNDMETRLSDHDSSTDAHRYLRDLVNSTTSRISIIKEAIDAEIAALGNRVDAADSTLAAADAQLGNRIDNLAAEVDELRGIIDSTGIAFEASINSDVSGDTPIIQSTADTDSVTLSELPSEHGNFRFSTKVTKNVITYTDDNNTSGTPNYTAVLLDESGNSNFPGTVTANTFNGKATEAVISDTTKKLETAINITVKDAGGENSGVTATTDMSGDITLKLPSTLKDTNITGVANKAISDGAGATITDTYIHKTNINEEIHGNKTFNDVLKGSHIEPAIHTGSVLGTSTNPYEYVYSTNITGVTANIPNVTGNLTGNADTATKLATTRKINGTDFDGTTAITTAKWGTARNISVSDASGENVSTAVSVDGSGNVTLKLPDTIKGSFIGNASTATQIITNKKINGTVFNGTSDVTTAKWGATRNLVITDSTGSYIGMPVSVDGSSDITVKLPSVISGTITGNASTATEFNATTTVALTGDATGTSAGSKRGWSIPVTLANSGVTAGKYGPSANVTGNEGATIAVPEITVDAKGRVTKVTNRTLTCKNTTYTIPTKTSQLTNDSGFLTRHQDLSNYVKLDWPQTITGIKTIAADLKFSTDKTKGTAPAVASDRYFVKYVDSAGSIISVISNRYSTNKSSLTEIKAYDTTVSGGGVKGSIGIGCDASGNVYTVAPTPATNDNSTKIATTKWVKSQNYMTGLANSGVTAGSYGNSTNQTPAYGGTFNVPYITVDAKGIVTSIANKTVKIPDKALDAVLNSRQTVNCVKGIDISGTDKFIIHHARLTVDKYGRVTNVSDLTDTEISLASFITTSDHPVIGEDAQTGYTANAVHAKYATVPGSSIHTSYDKTKHELSGSVAGAVIIMSDSKEIDSYDESHSYSSGNQTVRVHVYSCTYRKLTIL